MKQWQISLDWDTDCQEDTGADEYVVEGEEKVGKKKMMDLSESPWHSWWISQVRLHSSS